MLRILSIALAVALLALPAAAIGQDSGTDAYTENPPTAGGDEDTGSTDTTDGSTGTTPGATTFGDSTGAGTADTNADGVLSEDEAAAAGTTPDGQLPATGLDETLVMAIIGALLLAVGFGLRRLTMVPA